MTTYQITKLLFQHLFFGEGATR